MYETNFQLKGWHDSHMQSDSLVSCNARIVFNFARLNRHVFFVFCFLTCCFLTHGSANGYSWWFESLYKKRTAVISRYLDFCLLMPQKYHPPQKPKHHWDYQKFGMFVWVFCFLICLREIPNIFVPSSRRAFLGAKNSMPSRTPKHAAKLYAIMAPWRFVGLDAWSWRIPFLGGCIL